MTAPIIVLGTKKPFKPGSSGHDLSSSYANNFEHDWMASTAGGAHQHIESLFIHTMFRKLISRMTEKMAWIKSPENASLYSDWRGLINHVKIYYGGVFRMVALSGLMDSTKQLVKTQYKVEGQHHHIGR